MKNIKKFSIVLLILVGLFFAQHLMYPNVVTGLEPVKNANKKAIAALNNVANVKNRDSALAVAINHLDQHGRTLEERVAHWVEYDFKKIDSMRFKLVSGVGISATDAEQKVTEGYTHNQVVVEIFSQGKTIEYFLQCANGLVSKRWPNSVSEKSIGNTKVVDHSTVFSFERDSIVTIKTGESLCSLLNMTIDEAKDLAQRAGLKMFNKKGKTIVIISPGDKFQKIGNVWQKIE